MKLKTIIISALIALFSIYSVQPIVLAGGKVEGIVECKPVTLDVELTKWLSIELDTGIRVCEVTELRSKNINYGQIALAYAMAAESDSSVTDVIHMRWEEKMGWGKIAHRLGIKVSDAVHRASYILQKSNMEDESIKIKVYIDTDDDDFDNHPGHNNHKNKNKHHNK